MSSLFAFMILVSCSDGLHNCRVAEDMFIAFPTVEYCELQLEPSIRKISLRGEQIFGRCMSANNDLVSSDATVNWQVDLNGDFYVDIHDDKGENDPSPMISVWLNWIGGMPAA